MTRMKKEAASAKTVDCVGLIGPMEIAWKQIFKDGLKALSPCLVIVWHEEWLRSEHGLWAKLLEKLRSLEANARILVVIFGETPDLLGEEKIGNPVKFLLRALVADRAANAKERGGCVGWASISEVARFSSAAVEWSPKGRRDDSALMRLCEVCAAVSNQKKKLEDYPSVTLEDFFLFLAEPAKFRAARLHGAETAEKGKMGLRLLKWLAAHALTPRKTPLKILLVENKPGKIGTTPTRDDLRKQDNGEDRDLGKIDASIWGRLGNLALKTSPLGYLTEATIYLVTGDVESDFNSLRSVQGRKDLKAKVWKSSASSGRGKAKKGVDIPWADIDLVLQDIVLDVEDPRLTGLELVSHYFEACPQALVFVLTSLDVESLVGSGDVNWRYVDCLVSKEAMETLWYEYRRCFQERYGRMFWPDWSCAEPDDRKLLRGLFSSLRRWQIEPDILWHGQTLPEMIDHAHRHITALWKLTNDFIGTLLENGGADTEVLSLRHRVALAVAVWMHDVGHRGDEYIAGSMEIRASHAGISERLLLRNPAAYQLGWLLAESLIPHQSCRAKKSDGGDGGRAERLDCRNETSCRSKQGGKGQPLCLLREAGLLCRHHQSNAPLDGKSLAHMAGRGKEPTVYSLIPDSDDMALTSEVFLQAMTNDALPMPSPRGTKLRTLEDFVTSQPNEFRSVAGILRILDALQLHRSRVGTSAFSASFYEFLETKFVWCQSERKRLEADRRAATPGRNAFQRISAKLSDLDEYEILLTTQQVHFWRQASVHEVEVVWTWAAGGKATAAILFTLSERALAQLDEIKASLPKSTGRSVEHILSDLLAPFGTAGPSEKWIENLKDEVVGSEHKSQYPGGITNRKAGYLGVLRSEVGFRVGVSGTDQKSFEKPKFIEP